jgi:hypothetical protein
VNIHGGFLMILRLISNLLRPPVVGRVADVQETLGLTEEQKRKRWRAHLAARRKFGKPFMIRRINGQRG